MPMRAVSVLTTATLLLGPDPTRKTASIANFGTETCYLSNDKSISTGSGFPIYSGQGVDISAEYGDDPTFPLWAISPTIANDFRVYEAYGTRTDKAG